MNSTAHPNLHAVGLAADIYEAIEQRLRGRAGEDRRRAMRRVSEMLATYLPELVEAVSAILDLEFEPEEG